MVAEMLGCPQAETVSAAFAAGRAGAAQVKKNGVRSAAMEYEGNRVPL